ncbi:hypothetical protein [Aurantiacibacter flavus]|uniref:Heme exporter protein D n=1 Tax=Aurantiacibacter flavus TaxID=3145232 RepID=A0ABV0CTL3_9SPHN
MRETLDMMDFVYAAYAICLIGTLALAGWSFATMRAAEKRREESRRK